MFNLKVSGYSLLKISIITLSFFWCEIAVADIYCDKDTKRCHTKDCVETAKISKKNLEIFESIPQACSRGYYRCPECMLIRTSKVVTKKKPRKLSKKPRRDYVYLGDKIKKIYHQSWCPLLKKGRKKLIKFRSVETAIKNGYTPCDECHPPSLPRKSNDEFFMLEEELEKEKQEQIARQIFHAKTPAERKKKEAKNKSK